MLGSRVGAVVHGGNVLIANSECEKQEKKGQLSQYLAETLFTDKDLV